MIVRNNTRTSENEQMIVSDGFVLCDGYSNLSFKSPPFEEGLSILFFIFSKSMKDTL